LLALACQYLDVSFCLLAVLRERALTRPSHRFYVKATNCCIDIRAILDGGPDGGDCDPTDFFAPCRGFTGECGVLEDQFAYVAVLPDYPGGMIDYDCQAFPDNNNALDSFIVGLISIAIALPVGLFLESCFEIANDSEQPESILLWAGWRKRVCGARAHRRWHYTRDKQPSRYVRWWIRSQDAPTPETIVNLFHSARAFFTHTCPTRHVPGPCSCPCLSPPFSPRPSARATQATASSLAANYYSWINSPQVAES
jgi:hypothetical protein